MRDVSIIKEKIHKLEKKLDLLFKKYTRIGLSKEEAMEYKDLQFKFYVLQDEYVDGEFERIFLTYLYDKEIIISLNIIKSLLPWGGSFIFTIKEFDNILESFAELSNDEAKIVNDNLVKIHQGMFSNLEKFCMRDELDDFIFEVAEFVAKEKGAGMAALIRYIDDRYREFAELIGVELEEIEVEWI